MIVGTHEGDIGQVWLYRSTDLRQWRDAGVLDGAESTMGYTREYPDFLVPNDKRVLMFSPQGMQAEGFRNRNLFQSSYLIGEQQPGQRFIHHGEFRKMNHGYDFYAPQGFATPDGRRIVIGWLNMWESPLPEQQNGWAGMLSLPRELDLSADNRLQMRPAKEMENLRDAWLPWPVNTLNNQQTTMVDNYETTGAHLRQDRARNNAEQYDLHSGDGLHIYVDIQQQRLVVERYYPQFGPCGTHSVPLTTGANLNLRIFFNSLSAEIFANDGEVCLSSRIYPQAPCCELALFAWSGSVVLTEAGTWQLE